MRLIATARRNAIFPQRNTEGNQGVSHGGKGANSHFDVLGVEGKRDYLC